MTERKRNHVLYRFYNDADELLYVGITANPSRRLEKHRHDKDWWREVSRIDIEHFADRQTVLAAERTAIETERPKYNIHMNERAGPTLLVWTCDLCGTAIDDDDGYLTIAYANIREYQLAYVAWKENLERDYGDDEGWICYPVTALRDHPERPQWHVLHRECDKDLDAGSYWFDVGRIRTAADALSWTSHLMGKKWIHDTNWAELIDVLAGRAGSTE